MSAVPETKTVYDMAWYARRYVEKYGMSIVPMPPKKKRPVKDSWGLTEVISDPDEAELYFKRHPNDNMGVVLGPSRVCSFDVDDIEDVQYIFDEFGWDLEAIRTENPTIQGSPGGFRVMFSVPEGSDLVYKSVKWPNRDDPTRSHVVFELRAADEQQRQDVLPPSIHPETDKPYVWLTKPTVKFPEPPGFLLQLWKNFDAIKPQIEALCPWRPAPVAKPDRANRKRKHEGDSVIDAFNDAHDLETCLSRYGYKKQGRRYLSPHSGTGLPGVTVFDSDRCYIHHASDPLCSSDTGQPVSAFDLYRVYEHGGDYTSAVRAAAEILGMKTATVITHPAYTGAPYVTPEAAAEKTPTFTTAPLDVFSETPAPALNREWLPPQIADYAFDQAALLAVSPEMIAIPALVACAAAIHDGIEIQPKRHETSWRESARLWCAVVGPPSVRKSPSLKRATSRLRKINRELCEENEELAKRHAAQLEQFKEEKKHAKQSGEPAPAAPEEPVKRRMIVEDVTIEALSEILKHNPRGVLAVQDELTGWFGSMDAYNSGKSANKDRAHWLEIYNGGHRMVDRVLRGNVNIPNWSACMIGGIQPDMMRRIASTMGEDGLMQRFMVIIGSNTGAELDIPENADAKRAYADIIDACYALQPSDNPVTLSEEAHIVRERIAHMANDLSEYKGIPSGMRSHIGKWSGLFARLLLTYHVIECAAERVYPNSRQVSEDTALKVESLMSKFLLGHAHSFYDNVMGGLGYQEHVQWIASHILALGLTSITSRDITIAYRQWRAVDDLTKRRVLGALEALCWIEPSGKFKDVPGRATEWTVNPLAHSEFTDVAEKTRLSKAQTVEKLKRDN